jgi:hypothetical protein
MEIDFTGMIDGAYPAPPYGEGTLLLSQDQQDGPLQTLYQIVLTAAGKGYDAIYETNCYLGVRSRSVTLKVIAYGDFDVAALDETMQQLDRKPVAADEAQAQDVTFEVGANDDPIRVVRVESRGKAVILKLVWSDTVKGEERRTGRK